jgi:LuxR family maltose regulon positive regulatory protein
MSTLNPNRLLHTKLMPPRLPAVVVPREDLLARLDAGLTKKVGLVTAPTGFGKTTLVRMWIASRGVPFVWVTLDDHDNDPVRFWT